MLFSSSRKASLGGREYRADELGFGRAFRFEKERRMSEKEMEKEVFAVSFGMSIADRKGLSMSMETRFYGAPKEETRAWREKEAAVPPWRTDKGEKGALNKGENPFGLTKWTIWSDITNESGESWSDKARAFFEKVEVFGGDRWTRPLARAGIEEPFEAPLRRAREALALEAEAGGGAVKNKAKRL